MPRFWLTPKALLAGAFFVAGWLAAAQVPAACELQRVDERASADYVYDGDTLRLTDGRRLRFVGLDTPEMGRDGRPAQPYARAARERLIGLLTAQDNRLLLQYDRERRDRHGRLLAHPALADGTSLTAVLLREGLATHLVVPPNTALLDCYAAAEAEARRAGRGIWSLPGYAPRPTASLPRGAEGFHILRGRVERIGRARHAIWLNLEGRVAVKIGEEDYAYFGDLDWDALAGRRIEVRGWLHPRRDGSRMLRLRHPAALSLPGEANS